MAAVTNSFHTRFNPPPSPTVRADAGLTQQHFKDECDINNILKRYIRSGIPPPMSPGFYADLTQVPASLAEAFEKVAVAQEWFDELPSDVRLSFGNDPRAALRLLMSNPVAAEKAGLMPVGTFKPSEAIIDKAAEAAIPEPQKKAAEPPPAAEQSA